MEKQEKKNQGNTLLGALLTLNVPFRIVAVDIDIFQRKYDYISCESQTNGLSASRQFTQNVKS